jgi:hypothetical protein
MKRTKRADLPNPGEVPLSITEKAMFGLEPNCKRYIMGACKIYVGSSSVGWHLSISAKNRYPTWDEIAHARYKLLPEDIYVAMMLPPPPFYVNVHPNCFHLWEIPKEVYEGRMK